MARPYTTLKVATCAGQGYVFTFMDSQAKEVVAPTISAESVARALEGREVTVRNGGSFVELSPVDGALHIKGGPLTGYQLEGYFRVDEFEGALRSAVERNTL